MTTWPEVRSERSVSAIDLFSGCGGLSLGLWEAARAHGLRLEVLCAADLDSQALDTFSRNFHPKIALDSPIEHFVDGELGAVTTSNEREFVSQFEGLDFLIGGPPCQGHSDLNNHTRRNDPRNGLILRQVRLAELMSPEVVLIENVRGIRRDATGSYELAKDWLTKLGYEIQDMVMSAQDVGVAQARKRNFLVASKKSIPTSDAILAPHAADQRTFSWACEDLLNSDGETAFDTAATHSVVNKKRIDFLFDHDLYELPDEQRPDCHRLKPHSYKSVYGRMRWDRPAPTITTGFGSTGQGRFVHPKCRRTITPHEAARLQFFPDFFKFPDVGRRALQKQIGNAVPSKMAFALFSKLINV